MIQRHTGRILAVVLAIALVPPLSATEFSGCGVLVRGVECVLFAADGGGLYYLGVVDGFAVGDRVHVRGALDPECISICQQGDGCIVDAVVATCGPTIEVCGTLELGAPGCILLHDERTGERYLLDDYGGFGLGDRVFAIGAVVSPCSLHCRTPCLVQNVIAECIPVADCGVIGTDIEGCTLVRVDGGGQYALASTQGYDLGDRVFVTGDTSPICLAPCFAACLFNPQLSPCTTDVDVCGTLIRENNCLLLSATDGELYNPEFVGEFGEGAVVRISGVPHAVPAQPCLTGIRLVRNSIRSWCIADLNCDGVANNFDIDAFVLAVADADEYARQFPQCDRRNADANDDGRIDNFDIDAFVAALLDG
ncbi:MAG: hypothetical protein AB7Q17_05955 [Phycisphaerae bacterium]